jgi:LPS export ABC transporter protein LptC
MARTTSTIVQRVRRFLLAGFLALVGSLVALYMLGRERPGRPASIDGDQAPEGQIVQIGRGFHRFEVEEDGDKLFEIEAERLLSHESDLYVLEGVKITLVRDADSTYTITADSGSYSITLNEASLTGDVEIASSDGLSLATDGLELRRKGRVIVSSSPVRIALGGLYFGRANRLEFLFPSNRLLLAGKVEMGTTPGSFPVASLRAQRAVFFRDTHNFLAEGNVQLRRGGDTLKARRLSVNFDESDRRILFALASWDVEASLQQVDGRGIPSTAIVAGSQLSVVFDELTGAPARLEIDSPDGATARIAVVDAAETRRALRADYVWADFVDGRLAQAQGLGGVTIDEGFRFAPRVLIRRLCSDSVDATYDATGSLTVLKLTGDVSYQEPGLQAAGAELTARGESGSVDLIGDLASVSTPEGRLEAPRIHLERAAGTAEATDGVRAEMASGSGPDLAGGGEPEAPVRVEAQRADWTAEPQSFWFQGNVRAWQEENFLVSQRLGLQEGELVADGGVRSVWHRRTKLEDADDTAPPVTLSAAKMRYNLEEGRVVYDGNARIVQGGRSMSCPRLQLEINDEDDFERMYCEGGSQIVDADGGSNINGDAAIYNTTAGKVKVLGDPVRLSQREGGTISARLMVYDFATAIAEIESVKDEDGDLFMSSSEYFRQFGFAQSGAATLPPGTAGGAAGAVDPVTGLPVTPPPTVVDPATGLPVPISPSTTTPPGTPDPANAAGDEASASEPEEDLTPETATTQSDVAPADGGSELEGSSGAGTEDGEGFADDESGDAASGDPASADAASGEGDSEDGGSGDGGSGDGGQGATGLGAPR